MMRTLARPDLARFLGALLLASALLAGACASTESDPAEGFSEALLQAGAEPDAQEAAAPSREDAELPATASAAGLEVRYLANEGFLIEVWGRRVMVDGLFGSGITGYSALPPETRIELEDGTGEWSGIEVAFASHFHGDHFDPTAVTRFLESNPKAIFVSTPQAIRSLADDLSTAVALGRREQIHLLDRVRSVLPAEGATQSLEFDGISVEALNLHHGRREPPVENLGLIITIGDKKFLHFGDTEAKLEDFQPYLDRLKGADVALLPFWFLSSEWRANMVRDLIQPRAIVVAHLPAADAPAGYFGRWNSYDELVASITEAFPEARFPSEPGARVELGLE